MIENYREIYRQAYGEIPEDFVIHHINHNRNDNNPNNLVAIPRSTHSKYHFRAGQVSGEKIESSISNIQLTIQMREYIECVEIINSFINIQYMHGNKRGINL